MYKSLAKYKNKEMEPNTSICPAVTILIMDITPPWIDKKKNQYYLNIINKYV